MPIVAASAKDATLTSIDGRTYDDFCLGDTASLFGNSPPALAAALARQAAEGLSYMPVSYTHLDVYKRQAFR